MKRIEVKPGDTYGDLTVLSESGKVLGKRSFSCQCKCGNKVVVRLDHLRSGHTSSCGKCGIEFNGKRKTIAEWASLHGLKESTLRARLKIMGIEEALKRS